MKRKNWGHLEFLQIIAVAIILNFTFFLLWIMLLAQQGTVEEEFFQDSMTSILRGLIYGIISGILIGFIILIPKYLQKNWDLHVVVPYFLGIHLGLSILAGGFLYFSSHDLLQKQASFFGFLLGGLISIIAYAGEVKHEHSEGQNEEEILIDQ